MSAFTDEDYRRVLNERDEARAEVERLREMAHDFEAMREDRDEARAEVEHAYREGGALYEAKIAEREAFRSGAEAMRLACQQWCRAWENDGEAIADALADLRVEDKP